MVNIDQEQKKVRCKKNTFDSVYAFYEDWEVTLNASRSGIFQLKPSQKPLNKCFKDYQ